MLISKKTLFTLAAGFTLTGAALATTFGAPETILGEWEYVQAHCEGSGAKIKSDDSFNVSFFFDSTGEAIIQSVIPVTFAPTPGKKAQCIMDFDAGPTPYLVNGETLTFPASSTAINISLDDCPQWTPTHTESVKSRLNQIMKSLLPESAMEIRFNPKGDEVYLVYSRAHSSTISQNVCQQGDRLVAVYKRK